MVVVISVCTYKAVYTVSKAVHGKLHLQVSVVCKTESTTSHQRIENTITYRNKGEVKITSLLVYEIPWLVAQFRINCARFVISQGKAK